MNSPRRAASPATPPSKRAAFALGVLIPPGASSSQERLHRAIGQWGRYVHAAVARKAQEARAVAEIVNALGGRK